MERENKGDYVCFSNGERGFECTVHPKSTLTGCMLCMFEGVSFRMLMPLADALDRLPYINVDSVTARSGERRCSIFMEPTEEGAYGRLLDTLPGLMYMCLPFDLLGVPETDDEPGLTGDQDADGEPGLTGEPETLEGAAAPVDA
jgi:hypothetical protein